MPNYIRTKLMLPKSRLEEIASIIINKETGEVDFNKLIPMPNELNIEFSLDSDLGLGLEITRLNPDINYYGNKEDKLSKNNFDNLKSKFLFEPKILSLEKIEELKSRKDYNHLLDLGKQQVKNIKNYHAENWYTWCVNNWGTKWNALNTFIDEENAIIYFETAWDAPFPIYEALSNATNSKLAFLYADEDLGGQHGYILVHNGKIDLSGQFNPSSDDAMKLHNDIWGF